MIRNKKHLIRPMQFSSLFEGILQRSWRRKGRQLTSFMVPIFVASVQGIAGPEGEQVAAGDVRFNRPDTASTHIYQDSMQAIVNWRSFNVQLDESVQFFQPNEMASILNRVMQNDPSQIAGSLTANGRVFIANPAGVIFGANAVIDVGQLVAAAGNISDADFLGGNYRFSGLQGAVENYGTINANTVALIGRTVGNYGQILAPAGTVIMAAGDELYLVEDQGFGHLRVQVASVDLADDTEGSSGAYGAGDAYALAAGNYGLIEAGDVSVEAERVMLSYGSTIDAGGESGGNISIDAEAILHEGTLSATGSSGAGGTVNLDAGLDYTAIGSAVVDVSGTTGGDITLTTSGKIISSGTYLAQGTDGAGGQIDVGGPGSIGLLSATLDASGTAGGGVVRLGGPLQGGRDGNGDLPVASSTIVSPGSELRADATGASGDGGEVIIWSEEATEFYGIASARPGLESGAGGFIELSSAGQFVFTQGENLQTGRGDRLGEVLLDPKSIIITDANGLDLIRTITGNSQILREGTLELDNGDEFGEDVAFNQAGNLFIVGAPGDSADGINPNGDGVVYLFGIETDNLGFAPILEKRLGDGTTLSGGGTLDISTAGRFGSAVAVNETGNLLAVGAEGDDGDGAGNATGAVYMLSIDVNNPNADPVLETVLDDNDVTLAAGDKFGSAVAFNQDADIMGVGAEGDTGGAGSVFLFDISTFNAPVIGLGGNPVTSSTGGAVASGAATFGSSVSFNGSGNVMAIGAEESTFSGGSNRGGVYIFTLDPDNLNVTPTYQQRFQYSDFGEPALGSSNNNLRFGSAVAFNSDNTILAVGARGQPGSGGATNQEPRVFLLSLSDVSTLPTFGQRIDFNTVPLGGGPPLALDSEGQFGAGISLSGDGTALLVGAPTQDGGGTDLGEVFLFEIDPNNLSQAPDLAQLLTDTSPIRIYDQLALGGGDSFGNSVALSSAGDVLVVGAPGNDTGGADAGAAYVFSVNPADLAQQITLVKLVADSTVTGLSLADGDNFGSGVAVNGLGDIIAFGASGTNVGGADRGAAYIIEFDTTNLFADPVLQLTLNNSNVTGLANNDLFGQSLALDNPGGVLVVGQPGDSSGTGAVDVFSLNTTTFAFTQENTIDGTTPGLTLAAGDAFGTGVALNADASILAVGSPGAEGGGTNEGAVSILSLGALAADPTLEQTIDSTTTSVVLDDDDAFGTSVALSGGGEILAVGAPFADGPANGNPDSGEVFLMRLNSSNLSIPAAEIAKLERDTVLADGSNFTAVDTNDQLGSGVALNDGASIFVGGAGNSDISGPATGAAHLFTLELGRDPTQALFGVEPDAEWIVSPADIVSVLAGNNLTMQANTDITVESLVDASLNPSAGNLTFQAGRSILLNESILLNGSFTATANDPGALAAHRDAGDATITMADGTSIDTSAANGSITLAYGVGTNGNDATGAMTLETLNAGTGAIDIDTVANQGGAVSYEDILLNGPVTGGLVSAQGNAIISNVDGTITASDDILLETASTGRAGGDIDLEAAVSQTGAGTLTMRPVDSATPIRVGGTTAGQMGVDVPTLDQVQEGFSTIIVGSSGQTGDINVAGGPTTNWKDDLLFETDSGDINVLADVNTTGSTDPADITYRSATGVTTMAGNQLTDGGNVTVETPLLVDGTILIDTEAGDDLVAGNVTLNGSTIGSRTDAAVDAANGNTDTLTIDARGLIDGNVDIEGHVGSNTITGAGGVIGSLIVEGAATVDLSDVTTATGGILVGNSKATTGPINLHASTLDTSGAGAGVATGNIVLNADASQDIELLDGDVQLNTNDLGYNGGTNVNADGAITIAGNQIDGQTFTNGLSLDNGSNSLDQSTDMPVLTELTHFVALSDANVTVLNPNNDVATVAGRTTTGSFAYRDANDLTVGTAAGVSGITAGADAMAETVAGTLTVDQSVSGGADVLLSAGGVASNLDLNASVDSGDGTSLLAGNSVLQSANVTAGGSIDVEATNGAITMDPGSSSTATDANIRYAANGDVTVGSLAAGAGDVSISSTTGNIVDAQVTDAVIADPEGFAINLGRTVNVSGAGLRMSAAGDAGAAGTPFDTSVGTVAADVSGSTYIYESDAVTVGTVGPVAVERVVIDAANTTASDAALAGINAGGNAKLETINGTIAVNDPVSAGTDVQIAANGAGSDLLLNNSVAAGQNVTLLARSAIIQDANVNAGGTIDAEAFDSVITMSAGATSTAAGNIRYAGDGNVTTGILDAGASSVSVVSENGSILDAQNDTVGVDGEGFATQTNDPRTANLIAANVRLQAAGDIGSAGNPVDSTAGVVAASSGGSTYLYESDALTVGTVAAVSVNRVELASTTSTVTDIAASGITGGTNAKVETVSGSMTVDDTVTATAGDALLAANGAASDMDVNADVASGGNTTILARNSVLQGANINAGGTIDVEAFDGVLTMEAGSSSTATDNDTRYAGHQDVTIQVLNAGTADISVVSSDGSIVDGQADTVGVDADGFATNAGRTVNFESSGLRLAASGDIGAAGNPLDSTVTTVAANAGGSAYVYETDALTVGAVETTVNRVGLDSSLTGVTDASLSGVTGGANAKVETIDGTLTVDTLVTATSEDVLLAANGTGGDDDLVINADVSAGDSVSLLARDNVAQNANVTSDADGAEDTDGTIDVEAFSGSIVMAPDAVSTTDDDNIRYTAEVDAGLGILDAGTADVSVIARTGRIYDAQGDTVGVDSEGFATQTGDPRVVNILASGMRVSAAEDLNDDGATVDPLDTSLDVLAGTVGESIYIYETDALTIGTVDAVAVERVALESTTSTVTDAGSVSGLLAGTNAKVETIDGTLTVDQFVEATTADVLLAANGSGSDLDINDTVTSGRHTTLLARNEILQSANVTATGTIDAEAFDGSIRMDPNVVSDADDDNIRYTAEVDVELGILDAGTADVSVVATTGSIRDVQDDLVDRDGDGFATNAARTVNIIANDLRLDAQGSIGEADDPIDTAVDQMAAAAATGSTYVYESDAVTIGTVAPVTVNRVALQSTIADVTDAADLVGSTALVNAKTETIAGTLTVDNPVLAITGDAQLAANGAGSDLDINDTVTSGQHTTLLARNDLLQSGNVTTGGTIDAEAFDGSILMDPNVVSDANDANIRYTAAVDVELGILDAGTGDVSVIADTGSIRDVQDDLVDRDGEGFATNTTRTVNIIGNDLRLDAQGSIGEADDPIDTSVDQMAAVAEQGSTYVYETDALTIGTVAPVTVNRVALESTIVDVTDAADLVGSTAEVHAKTETISGTLTVDDPVLASTADAQLAANGAGSDLDINDTVTSGRHTTLLARNDILQSANVTAGGTIDAEAFTGSILMDPNVVSDADDDNIRYTAAVDVELGILDAGLADVSVIADTGSIRDVQDDLVDRDGDGFATNSARTVNIIGNDLRLDAQGSIGEADDPIDTSVDQMAAVAASGSTYVYESDAVTIGTVAPVTVNRVALESTIVDVTDAADLVGSTALVNAKTETINGTLTVDDPVLATTGDVQLAANGTGSDLDINDTVTSGQHTTLLARNSVLQSANVTAGGTIDAEAFDNSILMDPNVVSDANDANIRYTAAIDVELGILDAGTGDISVIADTGSIRDVQDDLVDRDGDGFATNTARTVNIIGNDLRLDAQGSIGEVDDPIDTSVDQMAAVAATGSTYVYETDALTIGTVAPVTVNRVALESTIADVTDGADLVGSTAEVNAKTETINGTLTVDDPVLAITGDAQLAANGTGNDLDINATVTSGRHTTLLGRDDILQSANVTAGGTIDAEAFDGSILMDPNVVSDADDDNIRYTAQVDVELGILDAGTGNVAVTATTGSIRDVQDDLVDRDADGFATNTSRTVNILGTDLRMDAEGSIGEADDPIDTSVDTLAAVAATGSTYVYETDALTVGTVAPVTVNRVALESTIVDVTDAADLVGSTAEVNAKTETIAGMLTVDDPVLATTGDAQLAANGAGSDLDINATVTSGRHTTLLGRNDILQSANVTATGTIDAEAFDGSILMDPNVVSDADDDNIRYTAEVDVELGILDAGTADISVIADTGSIRDVQDDLVDRDGDGFATNTTRTVNIIANDLRMDAEGSIGEADDPIDTSVDQMAAVAATGSTYVYETDALTIGTVAPVTVNRVALESTIADVTDGADLVGSTAAINAKTETIAGTLTVDDPVLATTGDAQLAANGAGSDLDINATVTSGRHTTLLARNSVLQSANVSAGGTIDAEAFDNSILMDPNVVSDADDDNIRYTAQVDVELGILDAGTGNVAVTATTGSIRDVQDDLVDRDGEGFATNTTRTVNIIGNDLRLDAEGSIGEADDPIDTTVNTMAAVAATGSTYVYESDALTIGTVAPVTVNRVALESTIVDVTDAADLVGSTAEVNAKTETIAGTLTVDDPVLATTGDAQLAANGAGSDLDINATVTSGRHTTMLARNDILQSANVTAGGTIDAEAFDGSILMDPFVVSDADDDNIRYTAEVDVELGILDAGTADVSVIADTGSIRDVQDDLVDRDGEGFATNTARTVNIIANDLRMDAEGSIGEVDDPIDTSVDNMAAVAATGSTYVYESDALTIGTVAPVTVNRVALESTIADVTDAADLVGSTAQVNAKTETINGTLTVDNAVLATTGDVQLAANGTGSDLDVNANVTSGQHTTMLARNDILQSGDVTAGGTIDAEAFDGSILMDPDTVSDADDDNIRYTAQVDVELGILDAGTANVSVLADTGSIRDVQDDLVDRDGEGFATNTTRTVNIIGNDLRLDAQGSIGEADDPIDTTVNTVAAVAETGSIYLYETDALTIGTVGSVTVNRVALESTVADVIDTEDLSGLTGEVNAKAETINGTLTVDDPVLANTNDAQLAANGTGSDLDINATVTSGRHTTLLGRDDILQSANVTAGGTIDGEAFDGSILMDPFVVSDADDDNIRYTAQVDVELGILDAGTADVSVIADTGSIRDVQDDLVDRDGEGFATNTTRTVNIIGNDLRMDAQGSIGEADDPIDTSVDTLAAVAETGSTYVYETDALTIGTVAPVTVNRVALESTIADVTDAADLVGSTAEVHAKTETIAGTLTVDDPVLANTGDAQLEDKGTGSELDINATVTSGQHTTMLARNDILQSGNVTAGGTIDAEAFTGSILMDPDAVSDADDDNIRYTAEVDVELGILDSGTANISVLADTGDIRDVQDDLVDRDADGFATNTARTVNLIGDNLRLDAQGSIGEVDDPIDTTVNTVGAVAETGSIYLYESDELVVGTVGSVTVNRVALESTVADIVDTADLSGLTGEVNAKAETIDGTLTVDDPVLANTGDAQLAANSTDSDLDINATVTSGRHTTLLARRDILQSANVTAGGTIDGEAFDGSILMDPDVISDADDDNIRYTAQVDVELGILDAGTGNVAVTATTGDIRDVQDDLVDRDADGFATNTARTVNIIGTDLRMSAEGSIGEADDPIDTSVDTLAAVANTGSSYVYETDALVIGTVAPVTVNRVALESSLADVTDAADLVGSTAEVNAKAETINGTLTIDDPVLANTGDAQLAANGAGSDLDINATVTSGRHTTLLARNDILQSGNVTAGGTIDAEAFNGSILMDPDTVSDADDDNIRYTAEMDIELGILDAGTGNVAITATAGSIIDVQDDLVDVDGDGFATNTSRTVNITGTDLRLNAAEEIGETDDPIDTMVDMVAANAGGAVYLYESDTLAIGTVAPVTVNRVALESTIADVTDPADLVGVTATSYAKVETIDGSMTVDDAVTATSGDVLLAANGTGGDDDLVVNAAVTSGDYMSLLARDSVLQNANITSDTDGTEDDIGTIDVEAFSGSIIMDGDAVSLTDNDNIRYTAEVDAGLGILNAGDAYVSVIARTGRIYDAQGDTVGVDSEGFATQTGDPRVVNIIANGMRVSAALDLNDDGGTVDPLDTSLNTIAGVVGQSIYIYETDDLTIGTVPAVPVERVALESTTATVTDAAPVSGLDAGTNAKVETIDGSLTVDDFVNATDNDVLLAANGAGSNLDINDTVTSGRHTTLLARNDILQSADVTAGGTIDAQAYTGSILMDPDVVSDADDDNIRYTAAVDVELGVLDAGTGDVSVIADTGSIRDVQDDLVDVDGDGFATSSTRTVNILGTNLRLDAEGSIGEVDDPVDTSVTQVAAVAETGSTYLYETDALTLGTVAPVTVNRVALESTIADVTDAADLSGSTAEVNAKTETINGSITVDDPVLANTGDAQLAANGTGSDLDINATITSGQHTTLLARNGIMQSADVTAGGTIDVEAFDGSIIMEGDATSDADDNNIRYTAEGDLALGILDAGTGDVSLIATTGRIYDAQGDTVGVDADGFATQTGDPRVVNVIASGLRIDAALDVNDDPSAGTVDPIDLSVDTLAGVVGESIYVYETDDLTIGTIDPVSVNRVALESTTAVVTDDTPRVGLVAGTNAKVETIDGSINVDNIVEGTSADVLLAANGAGSDLNINDTVTSGGNTTLLARDSIAQDANVTAGGTIDAQAFTGSILMAADVVSDADDDNIRYNAEVDVELGILDAGTGNIAVVANTGDIVDVQDDTVGVDADGFATNTGRTVNLIGTDLRLSADGDIGEAGDPIDTSVDTIAATAAGGSAYVYETDALTIGTVAPVTVNRVALESTTRDETDADSATGVLGIMNSKVETIDGSLTVDGPVGPTFDDVLLAANGSGSDLVINDVVSSGADTTLLARNSISQNADVTAGGTIDAEAFEGDITMAADAMSTTTDGNVRLVASGDVTVGVVDAGTADISVTAGGNILDAQADTVGVDGDGFATNSDRTVNLVASDLRLDAAGGIGEAGNPVDTSVDTLAASAASGNAYVYESDAVTIGTVAPVMANRVALESTSAEVTDAAELAGVTAELNAKVETIDGTLTVDQAVTATVGDALVAANGSGDLDLNADLSAGGNATLLASQGLMQDADVTAGGTIDAEAFAGSISMGADVVSDADDDNIRYTAATDVELGTLDAGAGNIAVTAGGSIHDAHVDTVDVDADGFATNSGRTVNLVGSGARLTAGTDVGEAGDPIDTSIATLAASAGSGSAYVYETDALTIGTVAPVTVNRVALESTTADVTDADSLSGVTAGTNAKVETLGGSLTVDDAVEATGGDVLLAANGGDLVINAAVMAGQNATLLASQGIMQSASVMADGTVDAEAIAGSITMDAAATTETTNGDIRYAAGDDIAVASLVAGPNSASLVAGGDITDAGTDVNVQAATLQLTAGGSIGADDASITVGAGPVAARAGGDVTLDAIGELVVGAADAVTVNRVALESSTSTIEDAALIGIEAGGDVSLSAENAIRLAVATDSLDPASDPVPGVDGNAATIVSGGATTLGTAVVLAEDSRIAGGTSVTFTSTVDSVAGSNNDLAVHSPDTTYADNVGSTQALGNLSTTDAGDGIIRVGGDVTTVDGQLYGEATQLIADSVALTDSGSGIQLDSTLDGDGSAAADLTLNATGDITIAGDVGATNRLGDVVVETVNDLTIDGSASVASFTQNASSASGEDSGDTTLTGALDTDGGAVSINTTSGSIAVNAIDAGAGNITLVPDSGTRLSSGGSYSIPEGTITLSGDLTGGSIQLGPNDRGVNALGVSSIIGTDADGQLAITASGSLTIGEDEKFAVLDVDGDGVNQLTLRTSGGAIQHGDLTIEGDLLVDGGGTAPLTLVTRDAGEQQSDLDTNEDGVIDQLDTQMGDGIDVVATGSITYTGVDFLTEVGETPGGDIGQPQFALTDSTQISQEILERYVVRELDRFPQIRGDVVNPNALGGLILDAIANGEIVNNVIDAIRGVGRPSLAESLPAPEKYPRLLDVHLTPLDVDTSSEVAIGDALGIQIRDRNAAELGSENVVIYDDVANGPAISVARLNSAAASEAVDSTRSILGSSARLKGQLAEALSGYMAQSESFDASDFREYVMQSRQHAEAERIMDTLYQLWMSIEVLGLTEDDIEKIKEYIYSEIAPANLTTTQLHDAVMSGDEPMLALAGN
ncbi:MAG: filamentous hemagglutinin N-terminal domain-containing protein [Puniceicoccaceae bacterium]